MSISYSGGTYFQNFDGLASSGVEVIDGRGPHGLEGVLGNTGVDGWTISNFGGSSTNTEFRAQDGSQAGNAGRGVVSFGETGSSERALGVLATSNQISRFGVTFTNDSDSTLTELTVAYTGEQWRRGNVLTPNRLMFAYALGTGNINEDSAFIDVPALTFVSPNTQAAPTEVALDGNDPLNQTSFNQTIGGLSWGPGQALTLRWTGEDISGQDDGLAIDNFSFSAVPEPTALGWLLLGALTLSVRRRWACC